jgi:hypothetical protein
MYGGVALVESGKVQDASRLEIECCSKDGEFFRALASCEEAVGMRTIEFVKGRGRRAIASAVEAAVPHRQGWVRSDDGRWEQLSETGVRATSARQILRTASAVRIAVPDGSVGCVFLADGAVISFVGDTARRIESQPHAMARHVLPPYLVQQLAGTEAMVAVLEARIEGEAEWLAVESRRLLASDRTPPWVVRDTPGVTYRTQWRRLAERDGSWRMVDEGVHEPLGVLGIPAPGVR